MLATTLPTARSGAARHTNLARPAAALCTPGHVAVPRRVLLLTVRAYQSDTEEAAASSAADRSSAFHALAKEVRGAPSELRHPPAGQGQLGLQADLNAGNLCGCCLRQAGVRQRCASWAQCPLTTTCRWPASWPRSLPAMRAGLTRSWSAGELPSGIIQHGHDGHDGHAGGLLPLPRTAMHGVCVSQLAWFLAPRHSETSPLMLFTLLGAQAGGQP